MSAERADGPHEPAGRPAGPPEPDGGSAERGALTRTSVPGERSVLVRVPATSANLGPGFDSLGLALAVYDELVVTTRDTPGTSIEIEGVGAGTLPTDDTHLVARSIAHVFADQGVPLPGLALRAKNLIPHGRGMGSSGAAIVSGVMAAKGLLESIHELAPRDLLRLATELEGHPDNVAPCLFGSLTIAWLNGETPYYQRLLVHRGVSPIVLVPESEMSTKLARSLQPEHVPHADAVFNLSRAALLVAALIQSPELLFDATEDRLHQMYRASAMPATNALVARLREAGHAAVVSGAGPSVLVLCSDPAEREAVAAIARAATDERWRAVPTAVDVRGATVEAYSA